MKNKLILILLTIILFTSCMPLSDSASTEGNQTKIENLNESEGKLSEEETAYSLLGCWVNSPGGADRLADTYVFREDGTFTFYYNESFFSIRETAFSGTWEWKEETLFLTKLKKRIIVGGTLVPSDISLDHYMIEDGEVKIEDINPPEEIMLMIGEYSDNADGFYNYPSVFLNDKQYWRYYDITPTWMDDYWK